MAFNEVFTFNNLYNCAKECCKGVRWKTSTKNFELRLVEIVSKLYNDLYNGRYNTPKPHKFFISVRGKTREIWAPHIRERCLQKCLYKYCLYPLISKSLIYDNGACIKGKGTDFSINRLKRTLLKTI